MPLLSHIGGRRFARDVKVHWAVLILCGTLLAWGVQGAICDTASPPAQPTTPVLSVSFQNGLLSVEAHDAVWTKVLQEVRAKSKIALNVSMPLPRAVTVSFEGE